MLLVFHNETLLDCPNGFVYLNNRCFKVLPESNYDRHVALCHNMQGADNLI